NCFCDRGLYRIPDWPAVDSRQIDSERSTLAQLARHFYPSATLSDSTVHHRQPEPCARILPLRREKRIENTLHGFLAHPDSGVGDSHKDIESGCGIRMGASSSLIDIEVSCCDFELAPIRHGITSVDDQIHDDLLDLGRVCHGLSQERIERDG